MRDILVEGMEARFGGPKVAAGVELEFLSDNGGAFRNKDTHSSEKELGIKPVHTPVCGPQSNDIAKAS